MTETATKERPIIFTGESVRAILEGRKTQTRRVLADFDPQGRVSIHAPGHGSYHVSDEHWLAVEQIATECGGAPYEYEERDLGRCPYGAPGDVLWVREAWGVYTFPDEYPNVCYRSDDSTHLVLHDDVWRYNTDSLRWRSPIHMPRWASRLSLRVVDVRVERLRAISDSDLWAEGVADPDDRAMVHLVAFADLWDEINARRGFSWERNPWVWVVAFEVI